MQVCNRFSESALIFRSPLVHTPTRSQIFSFQLFESHQSSTISRMRSLAKEMRVATREVHNISDALVNAKLAFGNLIAHLSFVLLI